MHATMNSDRPEMVIIVDYDPDWPTIFQELSIPINIALGDIAIANEHVGSTAVPGLAAKPIIDIDVVVASPSHLSEAVTRLAVLGYIHQGDLGIRGREAFMAPASKPKHHLYVCPVDSGELRRHRMFRDYLRAHPDAAATYAALKKDAARRFLDDRVSYTAYKGDFIEEILRVAATRGSTDG
jgi:GrpB-like predicted nucleotidyltransferase (UPF0157 family)